MSIILPFPDKILWPNGRGHWAAKNRAFQKHKEWARLATLSAIPRCFRWNGEPVKLRITITPKTRHPIDRDNCVAAMKAYVDGVSAALVVDDQHFLVPEITFAEPCKPGAVEIAL